MGSDPRTLAHLLAQAAHAGALSARPMFGEHGLYLDGRLVALLCDNQLFVKPTPGGRARTGDVEEAPPYPGAKPYLLVEADRWDDADWLADLLRTTAAELPPPRPRKVKRPAPSPSP